MRAMSTPPASATPTPADRVRGRLMAQSLGQLLDRAPGAREVLPHLAALERSLLEKGAGAIELVPAHWLSKIGSQLASLPVAENDAPLQDLLARLLGAVQQERQEWNPGSDFSPERTVVIREITHSAFDAAASEQAETIRLGLN
jgi:hypothetical protein